MDCVIQKEQHGKSGFPVGDTVGYIPVQRNYKLEYSSDNYGGDFCALPYFNQRKERYRKGKDRMKIVIQRVTHASVTVDGNVCGKIGKGFLVLLGIGKDDTEAECERLAKKMTGLRIFSDENDKTNLSLKDVNGELLIISQFTLYADCKKGFRPNFLNAMEPVEAERLYNYFCDLCQKEIPVVERGIFGADMKVDLLNDGPFTIILE